MKAYFSVSIIFVITSLCFWNIKNSNKSIAFQTKFEEKFICKKWKLIQVVNPKIGSNDISLGMDTINYDTKLIAKEILLINQNNTYSQFWRNNTDDIINEDNGTWTIKEQPDWKHKMIVLKCTNHTGKYSYNLTDWYIINVTESDLTLMFQTRGGQIVKKYIPTK